MDMSIHVHILVDVAMQERDYHDALVVRRFLETFNRKDNHLVEAELPRLDAYIATLDGYYEYLEQRNRKPLKNGTRIGRKKEYLFVTDEASSVKDEETTAEQASLFIEFWPKFYVYQCEQVFTNEYRNICVYQILEKKGYLGTAAHRQCQCHLSISYR